MLTSGTPSFLVDLQAMVHGAPFGVARHRGQYLLRAHRVVAIGIDAHGLAPDAVLGVPYVVAAHAHAAGMRVQRGNVSPRLDR